MPTPRADKATTGAPAPLPSCETRPSGRSTDLGRYAIYREDIPEEVAVSTTRRRRASRPSATPAPAAKDAGNTRTTKPMFG